MHLAETSTVAVRHTRPSIVTEDATRRVWLEWGQEPRDGREGMLDAKTSRLTDCQLQSDLHLFERTKLGNLLTKWFPFFPWNTVSLISPMTFPLDCYSAIPFVSSTICLSVSLSHSLSLSLLVPVFECLNWRNSVVSNKISHGQDDKNSDSYDVSLQKWRQFLPATLGKDNFLLFLELFHNFFQRLLLCWVEK